MSSTSKRVFNSRRWKKIPGWFSEQDARIFDILLTYQQENSVIGDVLEIGAYQGKSSILLGKYVKNEEKLIVCDSFGPTNQTENDYEILKSYPSLSRDIFENHFLTFHEWLPEILQIDSLEIEKFIRNKGFRFIHIDGSHLYRYAKSDLEFAMKNIIPDFGLIVIDDFRAQHTLGVAKAFWESVLKSECRPLIFTAAKVYLVPAGSNVDYFSEVIELLASRKIAFEEVNIFDLMSVRILETSDKEMYSTHTWRSLLLPPVVLIFLKKLLRRKNFAG